MKHKPDLLPPRWAERLLEWRCPDYLLEEVQGDLHELFEERVAEMGGKQARRQYVLDVLGFLRPWAFKRKNNAYMPLNFPDMFRNYLKIAFRNLIRSKVSSFINISGLAVGMAVAMLIGLWMHDELTYNQYHQNYDRIAQVMQHVTFNNERYSLPYNPYHLSTFIRKDYGSDFKYVLMSTFSSDHILAYGEKKFIKTGNYMEWEAPRMLSLQMRKGTLAGLQDPASILLSESVAKALFGDADPMGQLLKLDLNSVVKVTGVYADLPYNSDFKDLSFIAPWELYLMNNPFLKAMPNPWDNNNFQTLVQLADQADMDQASARIKALRVNNMAKVQASLSKPEVFLHPMRKWHLYSEFKNGVNIGGRIQFVWLFGIIGGFVLLLACINFMNLSTARSQKRAKEVGIRKVLGSIRSQLMSQFFSESLLVVTFAFGLTLLLVLLSLPFFNQVADKKMTVLWSNPGFWLLGTGFSFLTGMIAGLYPALYLSSFQPVKVLKGTFQAGRLAALPRKVLVVVQFSVSVTLIMGTLVVFRQIQFAKDRPIGYQRNGLLMMYMTPDIQQHFQLIRQELKRTGAVMEMAASANPTTDYYVSAGGFRWTGKDPNLAIDFPFSSVTYEYGQTIGWQLQQGRDFSRELATDSAAFILNEAAVKFMGLKQPIGETIQWQGKPYQVIGVIKDILFESPYRPVQPAIYHMIGEGWNVVTLKINPTYSASQALKQIEKIFTKYNPAIPFDYKFVDEEYARKFSSEERIGQLAAFFASLAIFISSLGIFGLASFVAEQRTKEMGIRKVLGASVGQLWGLLSKDFVYLVMIAFLIATPTAYYFLSNWLQHYEYRTALSWWIFAASGTGAVLITLLTVSYQALKAAMANPAKSLRTE